MASSQSLDFDNNAASLVRIPGCAGRLAGRPTDRPKGIACRLLFIGDVQAFRFISGPHSVFISSLDEWTVPVLSAFGTGFRVVRTEVARTALRIS